MQAADANGIPRYDEGDTGSNGTFSGLLNRGLQWVSDALRSQLGANGADTVTPLATGFTTGAVNNSVLNNGMVEVSLAANYSLNGSGNYPSGVLVGTLPAGRRPRRRVILVGIYGGVAKEVNIGTDGRITLDAAGSGGVAFTWTFRAAV